MGLNETKKMVVSGTTNKEVISTDRGETKTSKGGNVIINTTEARVTTRTGSDPVARENANITDTSTVTEVSRSTANVERVEPKATIEDTSETKEIESGLKGNRDTPMSISYTKASGKKVYRAKLK